MLSGTVIQKMKQTNISTDAEKTIQRVNELWKAASSDEKAAVEALAGIKRVTVARTYKTGHISAKLVVAITQILNADPFYLTGEVEERGEYTKKTLKKFLEKYQYGQLLEEQERLDRQSSGKGKTSGGKQEKPEPKAEDKTEQKDTASQDILDSLTNEDVMQLMSSLLICSVKLGGKYAERVKIIKSLLIQ